MASKDRTMSPRISDTDFLPFESAGEVWFWFIQAQQARNEGARFKAGVGAAPRPCEPIDVLKILDRLYRTRRLLKDHLLVLRHYGRRGYAPDPRRVKEARAYKLWAEALERMEPVLERKGIVHKAQPHQNWVQEAAVFQGGVA